MRKGSLFLCLAVNALLLIPTSDAYAGPPYISDDPEPTDPGHWEIYNFVQGSRPLGGTTGQAGFDINYGGAKDLQLTAVLPENFEQTPNLHLGLGDIELAAKYRFLHQGDAAFLPDVAFFPRVLIPDAGRRFSTGRVNMFLPLWGQKDFGQWSLFGGGGLTINPGPGNRNFWLISFALHRQITDRFSIGVEAYHTTPNTSDAKQYTGINLGVTYKLSDHWSLLASGGPGIQNAATQGLYDFYVSLKADY